MAGMSASASATRFFASASGDVSSSPVWTSKFHGAFTPSTRRLLDSVAVPVPHRSTISRRRHRGERARRGPKRPKIEKKTTHGLLSPRRHRRDAHEASDAVSDGNAPRRYTACLEEVKLRDMQLLQLQKEISEWEAKLKQQQHLYEAVRSDRNLYSKNLLEAQDEISEMKRKAKIQAHQLGQLKEEISGKDAALVKISFAHKKIDKQC